MTGAAKLRNWTVFVCLAAIVFGVAWAAGWYSKRSAVVELQTDIAVQIASLDGNYYYDYQLVDADTADERLVDTDDVDSAPSPLSGILGSDWLHDIFYVTFTQFDGVPKEGGQPTLRSEIGDAQVSFLAQLPTLRWFALSGTGVTDAGVEALATLPNLERLWIGQTQITDQSLMTLADAEGLTHLSIEATPTSDRGLAFISRLPKLRFLSLGSPYISSDGLQLLGQLSELEELYLDRSPVDERVLAAIGQLPKLRTLSIRATGASDAAILRLRPLKQLEVLSLDGTQLTSAGLAAADQWSELRELTMIQTRIDDEGLARLANCRKLETLRLAGTSCTLAGVVNLLTELQDRSLADALAVPFETKTNAADELISVDLNSIDFRDQDVPQLAELRELQWLTLAGQSFTDVGAAQLGQLPLEKLTLLKVDGTGITDEGFRKLLELPSLRTIHVAGTGVSTAAIEAAKQQYRSLRVYGDGYSLQKN